MESVTVKVSVYHLGLDPDEFGEARLKIFSFRNGGSILVQEYTVPLGTPFELVLPVKTRLELVGEFVPQKGLRGAFSDNLDLRLGVGDDGEHVGSIVLRPLGERVFAVVVDDQTDEPIRGVGFVPGDFRPGHPSDMFWGIGGLPQVKARNLLGVKTDVLGRVVLPNVEADGYHGFPCLFTDHPEYSPVVVSLAPGHASPEDALELRLQRVGRVELRLPGRQPLGVKLVCRQLEREDVAAVPPMLDGVQVDAGVWLFEPVCAGVSYQFEVVGPWPEHERWTELVRLQPGEIQVWSWTGEALLKKLEGLRK